MPEASRDPRGGAHFCKGEVNHQDGRVGKSAPGPCYDRGRRNLGYRGLKREIFGWWWLRYRGALRLCGMFVSGITWRGIFDSAAGLLRVSIEASNGETGCLHRKTGIHAPTTMS